MEMKWVGADGRTAAVTVFRNGVFRIRVSLAGSRDQMGALEKYGYLETPEEEDARVSEEGAAVRFRTGKGVLVFRRDTFRFSLENDSGETILCQEKLALSPEKAAAVFSVQKEDDFVGLGDVSRERFFHRGTKITCWIRNVKSYICVPFFMALKGYGLLLNTTRRSVFDMACSDPDRVRIASGGGVWDVYLFLGTDFKELLTAFTSVTGRPPLPPVWSFGLWHICNNISNARDVLSDACRYRELAIPCDVIGLEPGWMEKPYDYSTEKTWNRERFPLMLDSFKFRKRTFVDALKYGMGYHFELWLCSDYDLTYEEERRRGRNRPLPEEEITRDTEEFDEHLGVDRRQDRITKPDTPWFEHLKSFVDWGADFFKCDASDQVNNHPDRLCGNGMTDGECHNFYPLMLMRQMWEGFAGHARRRPFVFTPCGWTTLQKWAATWTGDTGGGASTLCGMFNTCFVGHGLTTNDMSANTAEGIHFGYLLPLSQINNFSCWKMPWLWGEKILALHRYSSSLRSRLIPYLYSCMRKTTQDGIPFLLPPAMEFPLDPRCRTLKNEYLLGPFLLVSAFTREVYFPEGEWKDYWTGKCFAGERTQTVDPPEDRGGGLFVREGAIIPFGPVMQYRGERPVDEAELYLFPGRKPTSFEYYEDDGIGFDYLEGKYALSVIRLESTDREAFLTLEADARSRVTQWSATVACRKAPEKIVSGGKKLDFTWDEARREVHIPRLLPGTVEIVF